MVYSIKNRIFTLTIILVAMIPLMAPLKGIAQLKIHDVDVFWEDSLIIVQPEIYAPFSQQTLETLRSGINVAVDVEIQFIRTGYVKREYIRVPVQYNVFTDRYRVTTPIGPLAVNDYETVQTLFRNDLIFIIPERDLPKRGNWLVKVRAGERVIVTKDGDETSISSIEDDLSGIAGWFFKRGKKKDHYSEWSRLAPLPDKPE